MKRLRRAALVALATLALAFPTASSGDVGTVPSELGDEVLRLEPVHFRVIEAAMTELESIEFTPNALGIDNGNYQIVLLENETFYAVLFLDKVRIEDCDHPSGVKVCIITAGTPNLWEFAVTVSKDATKVFGREVVNTTEYRFPD